VFAVYGTVVWHDFVNYDDPVYVTDNPQVRTGLSRANIAWAFTTLHGGNWHPLTWLSHMLDCQLFGLRAGAHHLVNVALHAASSVLLFLVLLRLTGYLARSALVAALFALHPLHVESVAWLAERKDVLSGLFWMLTLGAYVLYVEKPRPARYAAALALFALGLLAKPMLVTLPFVLLLLDSWPLGRLRFPAWAGQPAAAPARAGGRAGRAPNGPAGAGLAPPGAPRPARAPEAAVRGTDPGRAVLEKVPFLALAALSCIVTLIAQQRGGAVRSIEEYGPLLRIQTAVVSYAGYLLKTVWPSRLTVLYPHPHAWPWWIVGASALFLIALTAVALRSVRTRPWLATGWFWYLGALVPVIGLVQVGNQAMADRYTYIPLVGVFLLAAWELGEFGARRSREGLVLAVAAAVLVPACGAGSFLQLRHWRDSETLFARAVRVTTDNPEAHYNLGLALMEKGRLEDARARLEEAVRLAPHNADAINNLGVVLDRMGRTDEAVARYREAQRLDPGSGRTWFNLGMALAKRGEVREAIAALQESVRLQPGRAEAHARLATALRAAGRLDEAEAEYGEALRLRPLDADARNNLGNILVRRGRLAEAAEQYREALRIEPGLVEARVNLGVALSNQGRKAEAVALYEEAIRLDPGNIEARLNLAGEYAAQGRATEALPLLDQASSLARTAGKTELAARIEGFRRRLDTGR
jgi:Flp pilus assembly protein TadD